MHRASSDPSDGALLEQAGAPARPSSRSLAGSCLEPGFVIGTIRRQDLELAAFGDRKVPRDQIDGELNRLRRALDASRAELEALSAELSARLPENEVRILDTHRVLLGDSVFIADVEALIVGQQFSLESAVARVVGDFERIFRLVRDERLRRNAVDLRDVGLRVLRRVAKDREEDEGGAPVEARAAAERPILAASELSVVDLFPGDGTRIAGVVVEGGELALHAATFVRSLGIPALVGVEGLLEHATEGQSAMLDAAGGLLVLDPDPQLGQALQRDAESTGAGDAPYDFAGLCSACGEPLQLVASCGSVAEVALARREGLAEIGLQRLELPFLIHPELLSTGQLADHVSSVLQVAEGARVTFRLASFDGSFDLPYLDLGEVPNPELGPRGLGLLLQHRELLERQLEVLLLAGAGRPDALRLSLPFVRDLEQVYELRDAVVSMREALRKRGLEPRAELPTGVLLETPGSLLALPDFAKDLDFATLSLDSLQALLLGLDRRDARNAAQLQDLHPYTLRALEPAVRAAAEAGLELDAFGEALDVSAAARERLYGLGLRRLCVRVDRAREIAEHAAGCNLEDARSTATGASRANGWSSPLEAFRVGLGEA